MIFALYLSLASVALASNQGYANWLAAKYLKEDPCGMIFGANDNPDRGVVAWCRRICLENGPSAAYSEGCKAADEAVELDSVLRDGVYVGSLPSTNITHSSVSPTECAARCLANPYCDYWDFGPHLGENGKIEEGINTCSTASFSDLRLLQDNVFLDEDKYLDDPHELRSQAKCGGLYMRYFMKSDLFWLGDDDATRAKSRISRFTNLKGIADNCDLISNAPTQPPTTTKTTPPTTRTTSTTTQVTKTPTTTMRTYTTSQATTESHTSAEASRRTKSSTNAVPLPSSADLRTTPHLRTTATPEITENCKPTGAGDCTDESTDEHCGAPKCQRSGVDIGIDVHVD